MAISSSLLGLRNIQIIHSTMSTDYSATLFFHSWTCVCYHLWLLLSPPILHLSLRSAKICVTECMKSNSALVSADCDVIRSGLCWIELLGSAYYQLMGCVVVFLGILRQFMRCSSSWSWTIIGVCCKAPEVLSIACKQLPRGRVCFCNWLLHLGQSLPPQFASPCTAWIDTNEPLSKKHKAVTC